MIAWLLISFFVLLFLGVPIAMSLGLSAMGGILFLGGGSTVTIAQRMFEGMNSFALLAIPLYTFAGFTMSKGGISKRLMDFCYSIVGHIYGGLAHVNVLSSMIFAGISGSAVADTAGVSGMFMPEMIRKGYSKNFTVAVTAISSTIGIIIPPSIPMVVIAGILGISTGKLFLGGIIPGILCGLAQMIVSYFLAKKEGVPKGARSLHHRPCAARPVGELARPAHAYHHRGHHHHGYRQPHRGRRDRCCLRSVCRRHHLPRTQVGRTSSLPLQRPSAPAAVSSSLSALQSCTPSC